MPAKTTRALGALAVALAAGAAPCLATAGARAAAPLTLAPCHVTGVEARLLCGVLSRPLDPAVPGGPSIAVHVAVLPALARNKRPDPVFFFAGGPGQSAIALAGPVSRLLARLSNRRDLVFIDQRGTGRSAPLKCDDDPPTRPLADALREAGDPAAQAARMRRCLQVLQTLPHGDLRHYTTTVAMQDVEAVRLALGAPQVNLIGGSYGTRAALEYLRAYPAAVRRAVLDGVAPPDMGLAASVSPDSQAAFDALLAWCAAEPACAARYPQLASQWRALLAALPRETVLQHPLLLQEERVTVTREVVLGLVRLALYSPLLASALPLAVAEGAQGRLQALAGLAGAAGAGGSRQTALAMGMHYAVVCSEDLPLIERAAPREPRGADFGDAGGELYRRVCADWPRGAVPEAFYAIPPSPSPVLALSGGIDPATPPRHGQRAVAALGPRARHVVVPNAGHGVMSIGCMRDVIHRFVDSDGEAAALAVDTACATAIPRPPAFAPLQGEGRAR